MKNTKVIRKVFFVVIITVILLTKSNNIAVADEGTTFNVNVKESLSVSVSTPTVWASGDVDTFLRNKVSISVSSNNAAGFTASMTTKTDNTALVNTSKNAATLPTINATTYPSGVQRSAFPANYWGYSLNDTEVGDNSSTYSALVGASSTPITLLTSATATTGSKDFYFGAKADLTQASGTYVGTVVISVVSGVVDNSNPVTPTDPVTPGSDQVANYDGNKNTTSYTYSSTSSGTSSTTTQISTGDNRNAYSGYTPPQGVTYSTKSNLNTGSTLAMGLGIAAAIAATSGFFFLTAARREGEDDDEEDQR